MKKLFLTSYFARTADLFKQSCVDSASEKKIVLIPTAANVDEYKKHIEKAEQKLTELGFAVERLDLPAVTECIAREKIEQTPYLYVAGGNTFYLLQELKRKNLLPLIVERVNKGMVYIGESAGGMITAPNIEYVELMDPKELGPELTDYAALNLVDFYFVPHEGEFPFAEAVEEMKRVYGDKHKLVAINNSEAVVVDGDKVKKL
ncbi:MAG TPA: Type 1 glutamine amidotransferase-like domain-containing protein [Candidatus Avacidaminococcus intestinavium]|uniref:Type 1 glutamine amidotransferase-like domain-containing protein n=1 Tax=Candidatus Avacidaminococcus intestinavium TaxID=2840684 RepID=A0A9D1MNV9_9FIRM|nr:Type 1 glutamine amidotransferase-like domain-containing protein [Candidatus Avacidaminococcus intestinavium]